MLYLPSDALVTVKVIPNTAQSPFFVDTPNTQVQSADATAFGKSVMYFVSDASNRFRNRMDCPWDPGDCASKVPFAGATTTFVRTTRKGGEVSATLYDGSSKEEAVTIYKQHLEYVKSLWPEKQIIVGGDESSSHAEVRLARKIELRFEHYHMVSDDSYNVHLSLTALGY
jgi:hypothetical protein